MELFLFLLSYWEFYVFEIPYIIGAIWIYWMLGQKQYRSGWALFATGTVFWIIFILGFVGVAFGAEILIMLRHAEKV